MTDEQIEKALNTCTFGQTKVDRCKDCPLDSEKEPCITNLHLMARKSRQIPTIRSKTVK